MMFWFHICYSYLAYNICKFWVGHWTFFILFIPSFNIPLWSPYKDITCGWDPVICGIEDTDVADRSAPQSKWLGYIFHFIALSTSAVSLPLLKRIIWRVESLYKTLIQYSWRFMLLAEICSQNEYFQKL